MKKTSSHRPVPRPPLKLALCAGLGALTLTMPGYVGGADRSPEATGSAQAKKVSCPTLAFTSTRDIDPADPPLPTPGEDTFRRAEIYLMDLDPAAQDPNLHGTNVRRLTENEHGDGFANLSPDGTGRIVFDSNRQRGTGRLNTSDLFLMTKKGNGQKFLVHGGSPSWSPDGKSIAFHASADGTGLPIKPDPGAATSNSDIFIAKVGHLLDGKPPTNLTNSPGMIDDDPEWSPDGQTIAYTSHPDTDNANNSVHAEIYLRRADGSHFADDGSFVKQLTVNLEEERAPAWSPDGSKIAYMCRQPAALFPPGTGAGMRFEICVMSADGTAQRRLTNNLVFESSPTWLPSELVGADVVHRLVIGRNVADGGQGLVMLSFTDAPGLASEEQLRFDGLDDPNLPAGTTYLFPKYGVLKGKCK